MFSLLVSRITVFTAEYLGFVLIAVFFLYLVYRKRCGGVFARRDFFYSFSVAGSAWLLAAIIKILVHAPRPFVLRGFDPLFFANGYSFPSGHTAFFVAFAFTLFRYNRLLGWWFLVGGLLIGLARIYAGVHTPVDVLGSILLAFLVALVGEVLFPRKEDYRGRC